MFFGPRITTVFASRWKALGWAVGVMFSAYCAIPAAGGDADGKNDGAVAAVVAAVAGHQAAAESSGPPSPWGNDSSTPAK